MSNHFVIDMLPGREGDCLWIEYGKAAHPHRMLIDGGRQIAYETLTRRFAALPQAQRCFELLVCTHVDADHIEGLLKLVQDPNLSVTFKDVWFNGFVHLKRPDGTEHFGSKQGEYLTDGIIERGWNWNGAFGKGAVVVPDDSAPPEIPLAGGMTITLLSPTWEKLERLREPWKRECEKAGLIPGVEPEPALPDGFERFGSLNVDRVNELANTCFRKDTSRANGSSIAFLASFGGRSALLAGDAHTDVVLAGLDRLGGSAKTKLDAFKLSHHGSKGTLSQELLDAVECGKFLISTDGSRHDHPDRETVARIVTAGSDRVELIGNYASDEMLEWDIRALRSHFNYSVAVPEGAEDGTTRTALL